MSSFGQTLREAREARGLTCSQVAEQTHILVQIIEDMEKEDFHSIPAPIYGRGFVRLFAETVGLDPQPLVREFMDVYEGRRAPTLIVKPVSDPAPTPTEAPPVDQTPVTPTSVADQADIPPVATIFGDLSASTPAAATETDSVKEEPPPVISGLDLFEQATAPATPSTSVEPPAQQSESPFLPSDFATDGPSAIDRFHASLSSVSSRVLGRVREIPRRTWRITSLLLGAVICIALLVFGCIKLYQLTSSDRHAATTENPSVTTKPQHNTPVATTQPLSRKAVKPAGATQPKPLAGKLRSTGQKVPQLYID